MFEKAFNSIKGKIIEAKEKVTEKISSISIPNISNPITNNTFNINGKTYYENKLLGEGGYGYVFEVSDSKGNKYALKKMNILNKSQYQNILNEVRIWKQISKCPNIIKLLDVSETKSEVDILMELCTEGSLLDFINDYKGNIPENIALNIIKNIANGLEGMHSLNPPIAHRDVKLENVLRFGNVFKLCDFGSASSDILIPEKESKESKRDKFDIFERNTTFMYRPPEMVDEYGSFPVNEKVDIWALGCILYAILFKQQPFQDAQKLTIIEGDYYIPKEAKNYSDKVFDFIRWMLTPDPRQRPSAKDIIKCVDNWNEIKNFPLSQTVLNIKKRQIKIFKEKIDKKGTGEINESDLEKARLSIMNKMKKKNKYQRKDHDNLDGVFDDEDDDDGSKTKYKDIINQYKKGNNSNNNDNNSNNNGNNNNGFNFNFFNDNDNNNGNYNNNNSNKNNNLMGFDFSNMGNSSNNKVNSNQSMSNYLNLDNNSNNNNNSNNGFNFDNFNQNNNNNGFNFNNINNNSNNNNGFNFDNFNQNNNNNVKSNNNQNLGFDFNFPPQNNNQNNSQQYKPLNNNNNIFVNSNNQNSNNQNSNNQNNTQNILDFFA